MKKIGLVSMLLFAFLLSTFVSARTENLSTLNLNFCTGEVEDTISYVMDGGEEREVCYVLTNAGKTDLKVKVGFVDGIFTNDERQNRACMLDGQVASFGQYVTDYENILEVKAGESLTGNAIIKYPSGTNGVFHGCLAYSIIDSIANSRAGTNLAIQMRRAKFIDLLVGDLDKMSQGGVVLEDFTLEDGENLSNNPKIRIYQDPLDDKYIVSLRLKNVGSFDEQVVLTGVVSNILTYKESFVTQRKMIKGDSLLITEKLDTLPLYNMKTKISISNTPVLIGDLKVETNTFFESTGFIIWNVVTILTILGFLVLVLIVFLLVKDISKKSKKKIVKRKGK